MRKAVTRRNCTDAGVVQHDLCWKFKHPATRKLALGVIASGFDTDEMVASQLIA
ncbi:hypothetical protein [Mesorhizobium sp. ANAO-SY3R2]|uniref:hypothetical protein n=1 Tax=Mesorhizobium sp. ANAO-SY3R2 TaxID=3166644 RepID=UPI00366EC97B